MSPIKTALLATAALAAAAQAQAASVASNAVFATGPVGSRAPDSITVGNGSVWVEYGNGVDSTGNTPGVTSTIVQYNQATGAAQNTYNIAGSVDGLKINPTTGVVWALQNQDGNPTLSLINPVTNTVSAPLRYGAPVTYGATSGQGLDDVAFIAGTVFLSLTNPSSGANPATSPTILQLDQGNNPAGTLTLTPVLSFNTPDQNGNALLINDPDSLKSTPDGRLVQTSGDDSTFVVVSNPGAATQSVTQTTIAGATGGLDDVLFPDATRGTLYYTTTGSNQVFAAFVTGLSLTDPLASVGSLREIAQIGPDGTATPLITGLASPHGLTFVADVPEPAMLGALLPAAGLLFARRRR